MNGFEACRRIKAELRTHHIPVIIITALDQPADRVERLEAGADDFLTKPVDDIACEAGQKSRAARRNTRGIDLACRLGGEEFVVVMPDADLVKAYHLGERLRQCIAAPPFDGGEKTGILEITASVGVAAREFAGDTPELILKRADQALYCAKRDGRNRVVADAA